MIVIDTKWDVIDTKEIGPLQKELMGCISQRTDDVK